MMIVIFLKFALEEEAAVRILCCGMFICEVKKEKKDAHDAKTSAL